MQVLQCWDNTGRDAIFLGATLFKWDNGKDKWWLLSPFQGRSWSRLSADRISTKLVMFFPALFPSVNCLKKLFDQKEDFTLGWKIQLLGLCKPVCIRPGTVFRTICIPLTYSRERPQHCWAPILLSRAAPKQWPKDLLPSPNTSQEAILEPNP